jgi:hypothetical protein
MPKQELNLFKLPAAFVTQTRAFTAKVMGRDIAKIAGRTSLLHNAPDHFGTETVRGNSSCFVDCTKDRSISDLRLLHPTAQCRRYPERNGDGPYVMALPYVEDA